jgi:hypothetical protein
VDGREKRANQQDQEVNLHLCTFGRLRRCSPTAIALQSAFQPASFLSGNREKAP